MIAVELYGKGADFNTAADPIVRVDARRLRDRLREFYATASERGIVTSVPKGSYTPVFHSNVAEFAPAPHPVGPDSNAFDDTDAVPPRRIPAAPAPTSTEVRRPRRRWMAAAASR